MSAVLVERQGGVVIATLNRPEALNAFNPEVHERLDALWDEFEADPAQRVVIVTGVGDRAFSAGSDLKHYATADKITLPKTGYGGLSHRRLSKPVIAAVNGLALGGGFEFALCCDLILASENAEFGLPEVRIGGAAMGGGIPRLVRKIPYAVAMGLLLTARRMPAAEAYRVGLVNEVVPRAQLLEAALGWARDIEAGAPLGIVTTKDIAEGALRGGESFESLVGHTEDERSVPIFASADFREGLDAFLERRPPVWQGR